MQVGIVSLFPEMFAAISESGVTARGIREKALNLQFWNPRDYTTDKHNTVDDRPYGGGPGMLMKVAPLRGAIKAARQALGSDTIVAYLSPQGRQVTQKVVCELAKRDRMIMVAGRYEGIDERVIEADIDEEWSIGDYVLTGGELPAMVMLDAIARWLPGVLGHDESALRDSFSGDFLDCPHYTRPEVLDREAVPKVLLSGNHEEIRKWRLKQALGRTQARRPELIENIELSEEQKYYIFTRPMQL